MPGKSKKGGERKYKKVPTNPRPGQYADPTNLDHCADFATARAEAHKYHGVGSRFMKLDPR